MKCNETLGKWCKNKHGASKIIDTFETYQCFIWVGLAHAYTMFDFNQSPQASMIIWFLTCDTTLCFG
jgi:hypothetical protein